MNICLLASGFLPKVGGLEIVVHHLATALCQLGHQVVVVAPNTGGTRSEPSYPYTVVNFGFRGSSRFKLTALLAVGTLHHVVKKFDIDVIHVHDVFAPGTWARHFKRLKRDVPTVGTPHGEDINVVPSLRYGRRLDPAADLIIRRNIKSFDLLTAISKSVHEELVAIQKNDSKIIDIPNGIWTNQFQVKVNKADVRKKYGIPDDAIALLSVGRNVPVKGFDYGLRAVARVLKARHQVAYILVGRDMGSIKKNARDLGMSDCVFTPGQLSQDRVIELYKAADIYLSTSRMESFGLTTLEAMSSGLSCIVTDVPGNRDVVTENWGVLVPELSEEAMAEAICQLVEGQLQRNTLGKEARHAALRYDWSTIATTYLSAYQEVIKGCANGRIHG